MALASLTFADTPNVSATATTAATSSDFQAPTFRLVLSKPSISIKNTLANAAAGGGDEILATVYTIAGSGTQDVDLQSFTNMAGETTMSFTRVKYFQVRLLSVADDATVGTAASSITITPHATNGWTSLFGAAGDIIKLTNGDVFTYATPSAAGIAVGASNKVLTITNVDGAVSAKVQVVVVGGSS